MTDWYVTLPHATGLVRVEGGTVTMTAPVFRWMLGKGWPECKAWVKAKGGNGAPIEPTRLPPGRAEGAEDSTIATLKVKPGRGRALASGVPKTGRNRLTTAQRRARQLRNNT